MLKQDLLRHPRDTVAHLSAKNAKFDNLWYPVHYGQVKEGDNPKQKDNPNQKDKMISARMSILRPPNESISVMKQVVENHKKSLLDRGNTQWVRFYEGRLTGSLITGLGGGHVRETSLTLHQLYGVPYIPSSGLKGATRNWVLQCFFDGDLKKVQEALGEVDGTERKAIAQDFFAVFGHEEHRGGVQFHDGWLEGIRLVPDIMTVHFPKYYQNKTRPTDDQSPIPVPFYAVTCDRVILSLSSTKKSLAVEDSQHRLLQVAGIWMKKALTELGIGAKTTSGYGLFTSVKDVTGPETLST